jgi:hypothetical protein
LKKSTNNFNEFYKLYLSEHVNKTNNWLHFIGLTLFLIITGGAFLFHNFVLVIIAFALTVVLNLIGHLFFEKRAPTTYKHPIYHLYANFKFYFEIMEGNRKL